MLGSHAKRFSHVACVAHVLKGRTPFEIRDGIVAAVTVLMVDLSPSRWRFSNEDDRDKAMDFPILTLRSRPAEADLVVIPSRLTFPSRRHYPGKGASDSTNATEAAYLIQILPAGDRTPFLDDSRRAGAGGAVRELVP